MFTTRRRFLPSSYGDAGGAGARTELSATDAWTVARGNKLWLDASGHVFLIFPTTAPSAPRLQVLYRPDGSQPGKVIFGNDPALPRIVETLRTQGREATSADIERYKAMATARMTPAASTAVAPAATFVLPESATPTAPAAAGAVPKKGKKRRVKAKPPALYRRSWFPFAVGGIALLVVGIIAVAMRARRAQGAV
jgi:hypothetical protein